MINHHLNSLDKKIDRRFFLKALSLMSIGFTANPVLASPLNPIKFSKDMFMTKKTKVLMSTYVTITLLDSSKTKIEEGVEETFAEIKRLAAMLNRHTDSSSVAELNKTGFQKNVLPEIQSVLDASFHYHSISNGAFDITVKPLIDIYKNSFIIENKPPDIKKINEALKLIDTKNIYFDSKEIRFQKEGMGITFDGIAKGYIVDKGIEILQKKGVKHALINAGGDIRALGGKRENIPWKIAIKDPHENKRYKTIIPLYNRAVATSGNYEIFYDKDKIYHHIINPASGFSPHQSLSVSVVAENTMAADALATTAFVLGPDKSIKFIENLEDTEGLIIDSQNRVKKSLGWKEI